MWATFLQQTAGLRAGEWPLLAASVCARPALLHAVHARDSWKLFFCQRINYLNVSTSCTKSGVPEQLRVGVFHPCQHDTLLRVYTHMPRCQSGHFVCGSVCLGLCEPSTSALSACGHGLVCVSTLRCGEQSGAWARCPSRRYVAALWNGPSCRSRSSGCTRPMGGGGDLGRVKVWGWHQGGTLNIRQIEACVHNDCSHSGLDWKIRC